MNVPVVVQVARIMIGRSATLGPESQSHQDRSDELAAAAQPGGESTPTQPQHEVDQPVGLVEPDGLDLARQQRRQHAC